MTGWQRILASKVSCGWNGDNDFDNTKSYSSGGIRLYYDNFTDQVEGIKAGILLEAGFDRVTPNEKLTISSWAYDRAVAQGVEIIDNRAKGIACYNPGYTFVEKLQTIATKFRRERETGNTGVNFMRQYYDVYSLLGREDVEAFIGTPEYLTHKEDRFPKPDLAIPVNKNEAFLLNDEQLRASYKKDTRTPPRYIMPGNPISISCWQGFINILTSYSDCPNTNRSFFSQVLAQE